MLPLCLFTLLAATQLYVEKEYAGTHKQTKLLLVTADLISAFRKQTFMMTQEIDQNAATEVLSSATTATTPLTWQ
jgi:hypothetical protein